LLLVHDVPLTPLAARVKPLDDDVVDLYTE
jgi:hypothetical protein